MVTISPLEIILGFVLVYVVFNPGVESSTGLVLETSINGDNGINVCIVLVFNVGMLVMNLINHLSNCIDGVRG